MGSFKEAFVGGEGLGWSGFQLLRQTYKPSGVTAD